MRSFATLFNQSNGGGGGGVPVGGTVMLPFDYDNEVSMSNQNYLRSGVVTTDPTKFDATKFTTPHLPIGSILTAMVLSDNTRTTIKLDNQLYSFENAVNPQNSIRKSTDGESWVNEDLAGWPGGKQRPIAAAVAGPTMWMLGSTRYNNDQTYYWVSTDQGQNWTLRSSEWSTRDIADNITYPNSAEVLPLFEFKGRMYALVRREFLPGGNAGLPVLEFYSTASGAPGSWRKENIPSSFYTLQVGLANNFATYTTENLAVLHGFFQTSADVNTRRRGYLISNDGVTWTEPTMPANVGVAIATGRQMGWINGYYEVHGRTGPAIGSQGGNFTVFRTQDFVNWSQEVIPENNNLFVGNISITVWLGTHNLEYTVAEMVRYVNGWYWLTTLREDGVGKIYMSKDLKTWRRKQVQSPAEKNRYHPAPPIALGNKLLFPEATTGAFRTSRAHSAIFDENVKSAGTYTQYVEGDMVQYIRIK